MDSATPLVTFAMITAYRENLLGELRSLIDGTAKSKEATQTIIMSLLQIVDYLLVDRGDTSGALLRGLALNAALMR